MKKVLFTLLAALSLVGTAVCVRGAETTPISIRVKIPEPTAPRSPEAVPISAMVNGNTLYVTFTGDLGDVDYELDNLDTTEVVSDQVEGTGLVLIPFSGDPGSYTITFTLSNGAAFYGEFVL